MCPALQSIHNSQSCCTKNSWSTERLQVCSILLSQLLQQYSTAHLACYIVGCKWCSSDIPTSRSWQEWDHVTMEATQLVHFMLPIDQGSGCLNTAWHRENNGEEPHHVYSHCLPQCQYCDPNFTMKQFYEKSILCCFGNLSIFIPMQRHYHEL
jgi:hypothetical protein